MDYDDSGFYRSKTARPETAGAREVPDTVKTKVDLPIDLLPLEEVKETDSIL